MHKKIRPDLGDFRIIGQFPHCDQRILHAPKECEFCDKHRDWQELRAAWGIAFTGYEPEDKELPDPATHARGDVINRWHGNVAQPGISVTSGHELIPSADLIPEARTFPTAGVHAAIDKIVSSFPRFDKDRDVASPITKKL